MTPRTKPKKRNVSSSLVAWLNPASCIILGNSSAPDLKRWCLVSNSGFRTMELDESRQRYGSHRMLTKRAESIRANGRGGELAMYSLLQLLIEQIGLSKESAMALVEQNGQPKAQRHAMDCLWTIDQGKVHKPSAWLTAKRHR